ncbi:MAG: alpha/beta fold hydrolase [Planctomycetota bacterium]
MVYQSLAAFGNRSRFSAGIFCVIFLAMFASGCESFLGKQVVKPPNHGKPLASVDRERPLALDDTVIDHQFRVEVTGRTPASLAVWVIDPSNERYVGTEPHDDKPKLKRMVFEREGGPDTPRQTRPPRATILMLHGYFDTINQTRYLGWSRLLAAEGYRTILVDQRGHGRSTGDWASYGVQESRDMVVVLDDLEKRGLLAGPVGVTAVSLGASTAVQLAARDDRVEALVLISTFSSFREVVPDFGRAIGFRAFSEAKFQRIVDHAGRFGGFSPDDADSSKLIAEIDTPVLIFHGEKDHLIPIDHALRLYESADRDNVELVRIAEADHTTLGDQVVEPLREPMLAWFDRYLTNRRELVRTRDQPGDDG